MTSAELPASEIIVTVLIEAWLQAEDRLAGVTEGVIMARTTLSWAQLQIWLNRLVGLGQIVQAQPIGYWQPKHWRLSIDYAEQLQLSGGLGD